jgi:hypothetical protein
MDLCGISSNITVHHNYPYSNKALKKRKTFMTDQNMNEVSFEIELLDKHKEYGTQYQSNDFYWE